MNCEANVTASSADLFALQVNIHCKLWKVIVVCTVTFTKNDKSLGVFLHVICYGKM